MFYGNYGGNSAANTDNEQQENPEKKVEPEKSARARAKTMEIEDFNYVSFLSFQQAKSIRLLMNPA